MIAFVNKSTSWPLLVTKNRTNGLKNFVNPWFLLMRALDLSFASQHGTDVVLVIPGSLTAWTNEPTCDDWVKDKMDPSYTHRNRGVGEKRRQQNSQWVGAGEQANPWPQQIHTSHSWSLFTKLEFYYLIEKKGGENKRWKDGSSNKSFIILVFTSTNVSNQSALRTSSCVG